MREQAAMLLLTAGQYGPALVLLEQATQAYDVVDDLDGLGRVVASIGWGHVAAGMPPPVQRLEQTLARLEEQGAGPGMAVLCARLSQIYNNVGRHDDQLAAAERAVACARPLGDERLLADACGVRAWALCCWGRPEDALPDLEEQIHLVESTGQLALLCGGLQTAGGIYGDRGAWDRQQAYSDRAVASAERLGDPALLILMLAIRGVRAFFRGAWRQARADGERALAISRGSAPWTQSAQEAAESAAAMGAGESAPASSEKPPWWAQGGVPRLYLGQLCLAEGDLQEAAHHLQEAIAAVDPAKVTDTLLVESLLAHRDLLAGQPASAYARLVPLLAHSGPREGWEWQVTPLLVLLSWAHLDLDEVDQAVAVVEQAVTRARTAQPRRALVEALWMEARVAIRQEAWTAACQALEEGLALARRIRYPYGEARLLHVLGEMRLQEGETADARERLEEAQTLFQHLGARRDAERVAQAIGNLSPDTSCGC
jgi:tetratricopeptide (TPR) repeat protein